MNPATADAPVSRNRNEGSAPEDSNGTAIPDEDLDDSRNDAPHPDTQGEDLEEGWDEDELADDGHDGLEVELPELDLDELLPDSGFTVEPMADVTASPELVRARRTLGVGVLAVMCALLTLLPTFWSKVPATLAGLAALVLGYPVVVEPKRRSGELRPRALAALGLCFGLVGLFAGPLALNRIGQTWREQSVHRAVQGGLEDLGVALETFRVDRGHYPPGGTILIGTDGTEAGLHGWMTELLPYVGQADLYSTIDRTQPWDSASNTVPFSRSVPAFLVPGRDAPPTPQGYAITHFAGVGGSVRTLRGRAPLGIFDRSGPVRREEITDGLSQTLVIGEIASALPAWGDSENWREPGRGLNRQLTGFGSPDGLGAHFLMADGSVRYFTSQTSPVLLEHLSTRNADNH